MDNEQEKRSLHYLHILEIQNYSKIKFFLKRGQLFTYTFPQKTAVETHQPQYSAWYLSLPVHLLQLRYSDSFIQIPDPIKHSPKTEPATV